MLSRTKNLIRLSVITLSAIMVLGCSSSSDVETAPKGPAPEIKQMPPGVVPPDQRAQQQNPDGGEGTR